MALEFGLVNNEVDCGNSASLRPNHVSVSEWIYPKDLITGRHSILQDFASGDQGYNIGLNTNQLYWNIGNGTTHKSVSTGANTIPSTKWYHVVGTYDGSNVRVYLDGVLKNTGAISGNINYDTGRNVYIGSGSVASYWVGYIDRVRIYDRALSLGEIEIIYHSQGNDGIIPLKGWWRMNEKPDGTTATVANSVIDISGNGNHGTPAGAPTYRASPIKIGRLI